MLDLVMPVGTNPIARAMRATCAAAPKPLSMLTTTTLGAHEFSMVSAAANQLTTRRTPRT